MIRKSCQHIHRYIEKENTAESQVRIWIEDCEIFTTKKEIYKLSLYLAIYGFGKLDNCWWRQNWTIYQYVYEIVRHYCEIHNPLSWVIPWYYNKFKQLLPSELLNLDLKLYFYLWTYNINFKPIIFQKAIVNNCIEDYNARINLSHADVLASLKSFNYMSSVSTANFIYRSSSELQITKALKDYIFCIKLRQIEKLKLFGVDEQTIENMNKVLVILSLASLAVQVIYLCFYVFIGNYIL